MIDRYTRPEMARIWTAENRFQTWLDIEIYACEAHASWATSPPMRWKGSRPRQLRRGADRRDRADRQA